MHRRQRTKSWSGKVLLFSNFVSEGFNEAIRQTYAQEEYLRQSQGLLDLTLSIYTPLIDFYVLLDDFKSAHDALDTATGMLTPPMDKFMAFSAADNPCQGK